MDIYLYYQILGLNPGASPDEIKEAYDQLGKNWHSDCFPHDLEQQKKARERFKQIVQAYEFLKDYQPNSSEKLFSSEMITRRNEPTFFYQQGVQYALSEKYQEAIAQFSQAIRLNPNYIEAYQYRGFILSKLGHEHRAQADFQKAAKLKEKQTKRTTSSKNDLEDKPKGNKRTGNKPPKQSHTASTPSQQHTSSPTRSRTANKQRKSSNQRHSFVRIKPAEILLLGLLTLAVLITKNGQNTYNMLSRYSPSKVIENNNIAKQYANTQPIVSGESLKDFNFTKIDSQALSINYQGTSVAELAKILSHYATTEAEKARIIYSWIAYNIAYDVDGYLTGNYGDLSPEGVLRTRKGVCSGYANLYQALAASMGLDAIVVEGYAKGVSYAIGSTTQINHAWNAVKINNAWYLIDSTWGAGAVNGNQFLKQFNPYYFATPPEQFIYSHFPTELRWQLLANPYNKEQFDLLPLVSSQFWSNNLRLASHNTHTIQSQGKVEIILQAPPDIVATARLTSGSFILDDTYAFVQRESDRIIISVSFPQDGTYELEIFSKKKGQAGVYPHAITYRIINQGKGQQFPKIYSSFGENSAYLYTPLNKDLPVNQSVDFQIYVPNALEVVVIDKSSNNWTTLTRQGNLFTGNVKIGSGQVSLSAKFAGDDRYWTLAEFD